MEERSRGRSAPFISENSSTKFFHFNSIISRKEVKKPDSNPVGWHKGKTTPEQIAQRPHRIVKINAEQEYAFCSNFVKTSKYEIYNFLALFLLEEFNPRTKIANVYFLFIAVLQVIPSITNTFGIPMMLLPLLFVVMVDAVFMIIEDMERHRADQKANSSLTQKWDFISGSYIDAMWSEIQVGDILLVKNRDHIPSDLLLIGVSEPDKKSPTGVCYVETKSLDGETNLKIRQVPKNLLGKVMNSEEVGRLVGKVEMEHPNRLINNFSGTISIGENSISEPIESDNLLLRGCTLRNTQHAYGLVLNTGMDTKIMMSMSAAPTKSSRLSTRVNTEIKHIAVLMLVFCLIGSGLSTFWTSEEESKAWYLQSSENRNMLGESPNMVETFVIAFFSYVLLLNSFIPIALYVSMNFIRFFQSWFMNQDTRMYHAESDTPSQVRTMNLNEDLGQVSHVFSDKTGTLTCNTMDFRKCSIDGHIYGRGITEIGRTALEISGKIVPNEVQEAELLSKKYAIPHVNFYDPLLFDDLNYTGKEIFKAEKARKLAAFFTSLAICHTVIPEKIDEEIVLSASSPDDEALVLGAKYFGFEFVDRIDGNAVIKRRVISSPDSPQTDNTKEFYENYQVLHVLPFNSDRKRMSVICRCPDTHVRIFTKGADTVMIPRIKKEENNLIEVTVTEENDLIKKTLRHLDEFALEGLRTLVVANAHLHEKKYTKWAQKFDEASGNLDELSKKNRGEPNKIDELMDEIENELTMLGATGIEDKLQDGVPKTISSIMNAGIKVWVLTGDKEETAINIAIACQLIWPEDRMDRHVINLKGECRTTSELTSFLDSQYKAQIVLHEEYELDPSNKSPSLPQCLVIDGPALLELMRTSEGQGSLLRFVQICHSVVACRVTPDQKRGMVALIRRNISGSRTLSIGDGANDVPMIQGAHIGVGISGQEGLQAVNASDYAIAQFRFLETMLLVHGRWNYRRSSRVVCYLFYKSVLASIPLFYYAFFNGFSGTLYYDFITTNLYSVVFTALPILLYGIYDRDVSAENCMHFPELYYEGISDSWMSPQIFWSWMIQALFEGLWISLIPIYFLTGGNVTEGIVTSFYDPGSATFCLLVIVVNLKMIWVQGRWSFIHKFVITLSVGLWFLCTYVASLLIQINWDFYGVMAKLMENPNFWLVVLVCIAGVLIRDLTWKFNHRWWSPSLHHLLREYEAKGIKPPYIQDMITKNRAVTESTAPIHIVNVEEKSYKSDIEKALPNPSIPVQVHEPPYSNSSRRQSFRMHGRSTSLSNHGGSRHNKIFNNSCNSPVVFIPGPWSGDGPNAHGLIYGEDAASLDYSRRPSYNQGSDIFTLSERANSQRERSFNSASVSSGGFAYSTDTASQGAEIRRILSGPQRQLSFTRQDQQSYSSNSSANNNIPFNFPALLNRPYRAPSRVEEANEDSVGWSL